MTKHTPGPWTIHYETLERGESKGQQRVAGIYHPKPGHKYGADDVVSPRYSTHEGDVWQTWLNCTEANARLIAAAPQLAEALRASHGEIERLSEWLSELGHPRQDKTCAVLDDSEAALKAAGIEP